MKIQVEGEGKVLTLMSNSFGIHEDPVDGVEVEEKIKESDSPQIKIEQIKKRTTAIDLKEAEIIVSGGSGLKSSENWAMIEELAQLLGAATACSKPVVDMGFRSHKRTRRADGQSHRTEALHR